MNPLALLGLLKNPWILVIIACVAGIGGTGWYRMKWQGEETAFANYKTEQAKLVLAAQQRAEALSNDLIIAEAASMAVTEKTVVSYQDRIVHDAPPPPNCPPSPARRDASRGMRAIVQPDAGSAPAK